MNKWDKKELELAIGYLKNGLSYNEIGSLLNRTSKGVKIKLNKNNFYSKNYKIIEQKNCLNCNKKLTKKYSKKFCNSSCSASFNNKKRIKKNIKTCLNCGLVFNGVKSSKFCSTKCSSKYRSNLTLNKWFKNPSTGIDTNGIVKPTIKKYLLKKYNYKCSECGWKETNKFTKRQPLEVHHVDGNYLNNEEYNLVIVCPNCHSLTKSYKKLFKVKCH